MRFVEPSNFEMVENTHDTPSENPVYPAASYPEVWGNGKKINYSNWDSYKTVYGHNIIEQKWGKGSLFLSNGRETAKIKIDTISAEVTFYYKNNEDEAMKADFSYDESSGFSNNSLTDPSFETNSVEWDLNEDGVFDTTGNNLFYSFAESGTKVVTIKVNTSNNCYYKTDKEIIVDSDIKTISQISDEISVYPNPFSNIIIVEAKDFEYLELYNSNGQKVLEDSNNNPDLFEIPNGVYLLKVHANHKTFNKKIIKQ
jgi:hypothetical protein